MGTRSRVPLILILAAATSSCAIANRMSGVSDARLLQRTGVAAQATVTEIWDTGITVNNDPVVRLRLLVQPPAGNEYQAEIPKSLVSRVHIPQFQPGARVSVRIDPNDPAHVALDVYKY